MSAAAQAGGCGESGPLVMVTAIVRLAKLTAIEDRMRALGVPGISVSAAAGYGGWPPDAAQPRGHVRIEIFVHRERAEEIALAIVAAAHTGKPGDGFVAVAPVDVVYRVRDREQLGSLEIVGCECIGDGCRLAAKLRAEGRDDHRRT